MLAAEFIAPQVFPWYFGSIVGENLILSQNAEYTSAYGLTVLLFTFSYFLFSVFSYRRIKSRFLLLKKRLFGGSHLRFDAKLNRILFGFSSILVFFLLFWANGYLLLRKWANVKPVAQKQVLVIQPNAPLEFRDGRSVVEEIRLLMERIDQLSLAAAKKQPLDLIVLPESGVPFFSAHKHEATEAAGIYWPKFELFIKTLALRHGANVFFNELDVEFAKDSIRRSDMLTYNSSALYSPQGERKTSYQKVYLLIFGEYMPFEWMYALSGQTGKFAKGESLALIPYYEPLRNNENLTDITWGDLDYFNENSLKEYYQKKIQAEQQVGSFLPLICYEVIIPEYVRQFQGDPDFIVNVTNDKWYGPTIQSFQHHTLGRMRAIEFRKWLVRSTNSGTSVFTDHLGRNVDGDFTPIESSASLLKTVDVIPGEITFYRKYGNLLTWIYLLLSSLFFFYYGKQRTQFH
ncbi:apolipoprotein N-acyltransferase [Leptospira ryugenii]|uniref:Apolipoprotein N-acyltransferase n=2 Tax=Leptospira ryugenii TaxID=1917863 RepID=A0A2P2E1P3_9LEPT|nr:apolipoprotein N-acyltransferase [Leptospira ryugenii]